jgi:hypothetical protein
VKQPALQHHSEVCTSPQAHSLAHITHWQHAKAKTSKNFQSCNRRLSSVVHHQPWSQIPRSTSIEFLRDIFRQLLDHLLQKKDDHLSISSLLDSLKIIFYSIVSLNILKMSLTSDHTCLLKMKSFLISHIPLNTTVEMILTL